MAQDRTATLVLLSYNERDNLDSLLKDIPFEIFDQVLAIDAGSTDGTLELYREWGIRCVIQPKPGRGNAFILAERLVETEYAVFFSTDGNENPADLPRIMEYLREGNDLVVAGRYLLPGSKTDDSDDPFLLRKTAGILGSLIVRILWRTGVRDCINGLRGFKVASLIRLQLDAERHEIELQSTIRAAKLGMRIKEFGTAEQMRIKGVHKESANTSTLLLSLGRMLLLEIMAGKGFGQKGPRPTENDRFS
ncbi:putative Glycosyltransferase, group 2 family protein [uncultured Desulfatiglans sp.]|nr:putative Glycosyltransferase, group 2 family protein [uncultured Desulfatiglans sp.]